MLDALKDMLSGAREDAHNKDYLGDNSNGKNLNRADLGSENRAQSFYYDIVGSRRVMIGNQLFAVKYEVRYILNARRKSVSNTLQKL